MFNVGYGAGIPGFRVREVEDIPGFRVQEMDRTGHFFGAPLETERVYEQFAPSGPSVLPGIQPSPFSDHLRTVVDCAKIIADCRDRCVGRFELMPFPPRGSDQFIMLRKCIRDCVAPRGCSY